MGTIRTISTINPTIPTDLIQLISILFYISSSSSILQMIQYLTQLLIQLLILPMIQLILHLIQQIKLHLSHQTTYVLVLLRNLFITSRTLNIFDIKSYDGGMANINDKSSLLNVLDQTGKIFKKYDKKNNQNITHQMVIQMYLNQKHFIIIQQFNNLLNSSLSDIDECEDAKQLQICNKRDDDSHDTNNL